MRPRHTIQASRVEKLDTSLSRYPPFDELDPQALERLAAGAREVDFEPGQAALVEDGRPAPGLFVILAGAMELVHEGEVVEVLEPGESFGHPSLLTGMAPVFTVRARKPTHCALVEPRAALAALATPAGARYVARTMRTRLTRTGHTVHGLADVGTTPVRAIMRPAVFIEAQRSAAEAAAMLDARGTQELLVELDGGELAVITDAELRAWIAHGGSPEAPAARLARGPLATVAAGELAIEAIVEMVAASCEHLGVLEGGRVCGMLSSRDLLGLEAHSPIGLRHTILEAPDEAALVEASRHLRRLFGLLVRAGLPARDVGRVLSLQHDALVTRLIDFSIQRHGPAPVPWAWLDLGSAARREFTLGSDQDNALAYIDPEPGSEEAVDAYFEHIGKDVNAGLARCGLGVDNNDVLAGERKWRMSKTAWLETFELCLRAPNESRLVRASVAFDFRVAAGSLPIAAALAERIRTAREHPEFMRLIARTATGYPVALSFHGSLAVERGGEGAGRLNLKTGAIVPFVNLVRFHALANGVTISSTLDRIEAVADVGGLERDRADALISAFNVIMRLRLEHHAALIADGGEADDLIDPARLSPIERTELREALHIVRRAQRRLG